MGEQQIIDTTIAYVKHELQNAEGGHDWFHIERVWRNSIAIAKHEEVNMLPRTLNAKRVAFKYGLGTEFINVLQTLQITHAALQRSLGRVPRMAVAGLNPHAGEGGLFGREELEVIAPAIAAARAQGLDVHGPFAPDTVFMRARSTPQRAGEFDVVIAMYHDQGLIPVKYLGVEQGVNVTLGLPFVRTSPDHGTAFDIAGQGIANPSSLVAALRMAQDMAAARGT